VLVLPVATATIERVFSGMKIVKTSLRNRMGDQYMSKSHLLCGESENVESYQCCCSGSFQEK